jgi:TonB family protein
MKKRTLIYILITLFYINVSIAQKVTYYEKSGQIKSQSNFKDENTETRQDYYENGQIKNDIVIVTKREFKTLSVKSYYYNGNLMRDSQYRSEQNKNSFIFVRGKHFDENGKKIKEIPFMRSATFPGGTDMVKRYIRSNIIYPERAVNDGKQGKVFVSYIIDKQGNVTQPKIVRSVDKYLDEEALRLVRNMPMWLPEIEYGELIEKQYTMPVIFKLQ